MTHDYSRGKTKRLAASFCPFCFTVLDAASGLGHENYPQPGDFTICIKCAGVLRFREDMSIEPSSLESIPTHSRMKFAQMVTHVKAFIEYLQREKSSPKS